MKAYYHYVYEFEITFVFWTIRITIGYGASHFSFLCDVSSYSLKLVMVQVDSTSALLH